MNYLFEKLIPILPITNHHNNMKKIYFYILSILFLISSSCLAQYYSGRHDSLLFDGAGDDVDRPPGQCFVKVYRVSGDVDALVLKVISVGIHGDVVEQKRKKVEVGDKLVLGDYIITGNDGMIEIELDDGSVIRVGPNSKMMITSSILCDLSSGIKMELGKAFFNIKKFLGKDRYEVKTERTAVGHRGTKYSIEIVKDGDVMTDIVRVYEGSVAFRQNMEKTLDTGEQMKKLGEDYQSGKISIEEFTKKMQEFQKELAEFLPGNEITVNAGFESRITGTDKPTDPVPIDANEKPWWEDLIFNK